MVYKEPDEAEVEVEEEPGEAEVDEDLGETEVDEEPGETARTTTTKRRRPQRGDRLHVAPDDARPPQHDDAGESPDFAVRTFETTTTTPANRPISPFGPSRGQQRRPRIA